MEKEEKVQVQAGQEKQPEGQKKKMKTRTKVIAGVAVAALACGVGTGAYLITKNGGIEELLEDSPLADLADKIKGDDVDAGSAGNQDKDGADGASGAGGASGTDGAVQQTGYVDNGGAQVGGTSASNSYPIKMSDLCTFSDPSGLSFDTRYVLHGGSDCIPAKRANAQGYSCKEAYVVLYAKGGQAAGEYVCYVMSSEAEAQRMASAYAGVYNGGGQSAGRWGDVVYVYSSGDYVQTSIRTYYDQGVIKSETPAAYLGMQFYFGGMSEYQPPASSGNGGNGGGGGGSTPGGSTPGGTTPGGNTPGGNTPGGDTPVGPEEPDQPDEPDDPDAPDPSGETSVAVTDEQLTDKLEEALATADSTFPVEITDKYTFEDPEGLEYDTRYVLYGGEGSGAVTAAGQIGSQVNGVYEIYYLKDGKLAAVYRCYDAASADDAAQIESMYGGMGEVKVTGRVACINMDVSMMESMMEMYVQMGYADEATPEAYMAALHKNEGYQYFRNPNPAEEPGEPSDGLTGTTPEESFTVTVSDSYTFDEAQVLPGTEYDRRYVLYGDETNGFAAQQGARAFYDVIYEQNSQALYEIKIYVMPGEEEAQTLAGQLVTAGMYAVAMPGTDAVLVIGTDLQDTIDMYAQYGQIAEATPRAYIEGFLMKLGMTEVTADGNALSYTFAPQADLNRLLYEAEGLLETSGAQWNEMEFEPLIPAPGVLDPEADLSPESVAQAAREAEAFDPAAAGAVPEETGQQDSFDPAAAGNAGQAADGQSSAGQAGDGAAQGEAFDPAAAGSVSAGSAGTAATEGAAAGTESETAADGAFSEAALAAGTTADWNDPDFDDAADRLRAGSAAGPQELAIGEGICFADPQDLEFDTRLVFRGDGQSALAAELSAQRQMTVSCVYEIVYVKNGQAAAQYRCLVAGGQVFCQKMKPEKLAERISALPAGQPAFEASLQGYTGWMQQIEQLEEYKEGEETR
ncbi:hypothetical protein [Lachnoclostridium phocaeense]|uniref:hypothetical protein n=1 Tax=Lachnoclostridium phocaeense TaxID=1871021 RepID=UPI00248ED466|nr:hypothetical protein [Lachnoclostridium phocaeense]